MNRGVELAKSVWNDLSIVDTNGVQGLTSLVLTYQGPYYPLPAFSMYG
jgi:hypothetical protein